MIQLFDSENKFWQFFSKLADVACLSFLWFLTSLPLVTLGAATASFYDFTMRQAQNIEGTVLRAYFRSFRRHFHRGTLLGLGLFAGMLFFAADLLAAWNFYLARGGLLGIALMGVVGCCALVFLCCSFYLYPLLTVYDLPWKELLLNSFFLSIGNLHVTITLAVLLILAAVGIFFLSGLFFIWIGMYIFFSSYFLYGVFLRCPWLGMEESQNGGEDGGNSSGAGSAPQGDEMWLV